MCVPRRGGYTWVNSVSLRPSAPVGRERATYLFSSHRFRLGLLITAALLFLFLWKVDFGETGRELQHANYAYFLPAVLIYFVALGFRSLRWRYLLLHLKPVPARRLYPVVAIGYLANNILPVRLGELVRAHFLGEKEGVSKASGLATIGVERIFDGLTLLLFVVVVWPFLPWTSVLKTDDGDLNSLWVALSALIAAMFVAGFAVLFLCATSPRMGRGLVSIVTAVCPARLRPKVENFGILLLEGLGALKSPRKLLVISLISVPVWAAEAAVYYVMAISFDLEQPFQVILLVTATSNLATAIPSSIGGIGPFELVAKSTLVAFGVTGEAAAAYSFFVHIIVLWLPVNIVGIIFLWRENLSLAEMARTSNLELSPAPPYRSAYEDKSALPGDGEEK